MKNKYSLGDIVKIKEGINAFRVVGLEFNTYNKPKKIWYKLYRLCDGYVCKVCETVVCPINS